MKNYNFFENDALIMKSRVLQIKGRNIVVALSKKQALLVYCLMNNINEKASLIECIWPKNNHKLIEARYNQLVFKTRKNLYENGFPSDFILTLKGYGLSLNGSFFDIKEKECGYDAYTPAEYLIL